MMEPREHVRSENKKLLMEIFKLRMLLSELYTQSGPNSSDYITLSIKLDLFVQEYMEEKMKALQDELMESGNLIYS
ncbi:hypothetical protein JMM81_08435 [Bacillus sp. V3B]|uniref:hypothetical protein n=1 Tax=Bacillus sp. V3B TaxID=2804915 RepID=UPI002109F2D2|nr:hypothetical protein [Bacillus sp. V3B]MCQ6274987.1 hypothetical protein [Bacillus sp. V3B]